MIVLKLRLVMLWSASVFFSCFGMCALRADVILQPVSISSPQGDAGGIYSLSNIINQSGLSSAYTSGVTDFATYVATATHASFPSGTNSGFTNAQGVPQQFTFDLGAAALINGLAFWDVQNLGSVDRFKLFPDSDANFGNGVGSQLGSDFISTFPFDPAPAGIFSFPAINTRFVHLYVLSMEGGTEGTPGIGEVAFRVTVPEASALTLVASEVASLMITWRPQRQRQEV